MKRKLGRSSRVLVLGVGFLTLSAFVTATSGQVKKGTKPETPPAPVAAIAVQDHEVEGVEVALLEVKRASGNTVTIRWQYRNKTAEKKPLNHWRKHGDGFISVCEGCLFPRSQREEVRSTEG